MLTDLFAVLSAIPADAVTVAIPPDVRRPFVTTSRVGRDGDDVVLDFAPFVPRHAALHFVPSFSALTRHGYSFRFEASVGEDDGDGGTWTATTSIGPAEFTSCAGAGGVLRADVDVIVASRPVERLRLRLRLRAATPDAVLGAPWLVTLSACDPGPAAGDGDATVAAGGLEVPARSQMEEREPLRSRVCSPTSVAMVLALHGRDVSVAELAADMYHPALDLYGVWPSAIRAAARHGVAGYLLRFPSWSTAAWCLAHGMPIVASVRYAAGELTDAAIPTTSGHLLVLTGLDGDGVLVNDPAAPSRAEVRRRYRRSELTRVWLERAGVGYVFFRV
jgi:hypothetical protein